MDLARLVSTRLMGQYRPASLSVSSRSVARPVYGDGYLNVLYMAAACLLFMGSKVNLQRLENFRWTVFVNKMEVSVVRKTARKHVVSVKCSAGTLA